MRPGFGYMGIPDPWHDVMAPEESGTHTVDLHTGESNLIVSLAEVAAIPYRHGDISSAKHYFIVLIFNPSGAPFLSPTAGASTPDPSTPACLPPGPTAPT